MVFLFPTPPAYAHLARFSPARTEERYDLVSVDEAAHAAEYSGPPAGAPMRPRPVPIRKCGVFAIIIAIGTAFRLTIYLQHKSLWSDEALLGVNIGSRSFSGLIGPLAYDQAAPVLFLWLQKAASTLGGVNEFALRFFPLLAGIATVGVIYFLGRALAGELAAALAAVLAALSPTMVEYSNENKQYGVEALVTCLLLAAYVAWIEQPSKRRAQVLLWSGVVSVWLSAPAVFVLASLVLIEALLGENRSPEARRAWLRVSAWWAASFGVAYMLVYSHASNSSYMMRYWQPAFLVPGAQDFWLRVREAVYSVLWSFLLGRETVWPTGAGAIAFVMVVSALALCAVLAGVLGARAYRQGRGAWLLIGPLIVTGAASVVGAYPIAPRTLLFAAPLLFLAVGLGLARMLKLAWGRIGVVAGVFCTAVLVLIPGTLAVRDVLYTPPWEHLRPLLQRISAQRKAQDVTYISAGALATYAFYSTDWSAPDRARLAMLERVAHPGGPAFQNAPSRGRPVQATEGQSLAWRGPEGLELFGIPTGIETDVHVRHAVEPDSGWAVHEANRIRSAMGRGDAWVVLSNMYPSEVALADELERAGLRVTLFPSGITSMLMHVRK
jgi:hypothetical protein